MRSEKSYDGSERIKSVRHTTTTESSTPRKARRLGATAVDRIIKKVEATRKTPKSPKRIRRSLSRRSLSGSIRRTKPPPPPGSKKKRPSTPMPGQSALERVAARRAALLKRKHALIVEIATGNTEQSFPAGSLRAQHSGDSHATVWQK